MRAQNNIDLESEIDRLKKELNAVVLAHYYQEPDIQDIADFVGDSLDLSRKAAETDADVIVFSGVKFMADTAKILNPHKTVLLPDLAAGCSLEDSCPEKEFKAFLDEHPGHIVLSYINSSIEVKALSDIIVTSSNAEKILNKIPQDQPIIFGPDKYLGGFLKRKLGRDMVLWQGTCIVHERFSEKELIKMQTRFTNARTIAHPECPEELLDYAEHVGSTSSLIDYVSRYPKDEFIVLTEPGILHQMKKNCPEAILHDVPGMGEDGACSFCNSCPYMKLNTMEKLYHCMADGTPEIILDESLCAAAEEPIRRMMEMSK